MRYETQIFAAALSFALLVAAAPASAGEPPRAFHVQPALFQPFAYVPNAPWDERPPLPVWPKAVFWNGVVFSSLSLLFGTAGLLGAAGDGWTPTASALAISGGIGLGVSVPAIVIGAVYWPETPPQDYWDILREHRWAKPAPGFSYRIAF